MARPSVEVKPDAGLPESLTPEPSPTGAPGRPAAFFRRVGVVLEMIRFEHTLFALPFAFLGALLALRGLPPNPPGRWAWPAPSTWLWILSAMVFARSAAMAFNRLVDERLDRLNPRTRDRALPAGLLGRPFVAGFTFLCCVGFLVSAGMLNRLCALLSLPALVVILFYSFTKRFTVLSHFVLGYALSIAPEGSWIAVTGRFSVPVIIVCLIVVTWTAGFDILYACQDAAFDARERLHSIPARLGVARSLRLSFLLHLLTILCMGVFHVMFRLSWLSAGGMVLLAALLVWEHRLVAPGDLSRVNRAFFNVNALFSIGLFLVVLADVTLL